MSTIQVLIGSEGERSAIVSLLDGRYDVVTAGTVEPADLYLVDDHSIPSYHERLHERKREQGEVFCPVVLVRRERTRVDRKALASPDTQGNGVIDEILRAPIKSDTAIWRLDNLLTQRETTRDLVERKNEIHRREHELKRYETFIEQSSDIISVIDQTGVIEYQSPAIERVLGYGQSELVGTNAFDLVHPADREELREKYSQLATDATTTAAGEGRFKAADGEWRWLSVRATRRFDSEAIDAIVVNSRDITERKREEQRRQRTVKRITDAIIGLNEDWEFIEVNEQAESILDIDSEAVLGEVIWDEFPDAVDTRFQDVYRSVMKSRVPESFEELFEGMDLWFEINVYPEPHGGISLYLQDITERKTRERQIEELNREFETVFGNVRDGLFLLAVESKQAITFQRANTIGEHVLGGSATIEQGDPLDGRTDPCLLDSCQECLDRRETVVAELRINDDGGALSIYDVRLSPVVVDGTVEMIVGSARDITERKQYEQRLESQRDDLQLLNQMVRHDIRNDLQVIETHAGLLARNVDENLRSSAESVVSSAESAIELTREARDLAEVMLRSGDTNEPIPLATTVRNSVETVRSAHNDAAVEIDGTLPNVEVRADEMLGSVFDNILQNSIVHNDTANPQTVVSAAVGDGTVEVRIADNGPGIPDDQKNIIFEKGKRGEESDGTGVGLYLVDTLIDQYGGTVEIEDRHGEDGSAISVEGTVFVLRFPLAK